MKTAVLALLLCVCGLAAAAPAPTSLSDAARAQLRKYVHDFPVRTISQTPEGIIPPVGGEYNEQALRMAEQLATLMKIIAMDEQQSSERSQQNFNDEEMIEKIETENEPHVLLV